MIVLGLPWYIQASCGDIHVLAIPGSEDAGVTMIGHRALLQLFGDPKATIQILITDIIHYETIKEYITCEGYINIAPQTDNDKACEAELLKIYDGRKRVFNPMNIAACGGVNAWRFELV
jgi:hypothetical protein